MGGALQKPSLLGDEPRDACRAVVEGIRQTSDLIGARQCHARLQISVTELRDAFLEHLEPASDAACREVTAEQDGREQGDQADVKRAWTLAWMQDLERHGSAVIERDPHDVLIEIIGPPLAREI